VAAGSRATAISPGVALGQVEHLVDEAEQVPAARLQAREVVALLVGEGAGHA
jgi:hypothetical protein